jgi:hypothetical protein
VATPALSTSTSSGDRPFISQSVTSDTYFIYAFYSGSSCSGTVERYYIMVLNTCTADSSTSYFIRYYDTSSYTLTTYYYTSSTCSGSYYSYSSSTWSSYTSCIGLSGTSYYQQVYTSSTFPTFSPSGVKILDYWDSSCSYLYAYFYYTIGACLQVSSNFDFFQFSGATYSSYYLSASSCSSTSGTHSSV